MERVVFLDRDTMGPELELARPSFPHEWREYAATSPTDTVPRLADATIAITNKVPLGETELDQLPRLKMIAVAATGFDVIDVEACRRRNIVVSNVRGYAKQSVPEHVFALIFALRRGLIAYRADVLADAWERSGQFCFFDAPVRDIAGATLGIIGSGTLGQAVGRMGQALGMYCLFAAHRGADPMGTLYTPFERVLAESDVVSLHLPLTDSTRDLIARPELERMGANSILINTARGGVVNEPDLADALEGNVIAGAGIDCVAGEPPPPQSPIHRIKHYRNVIVTPHIAWASQSARLALWHQLLDCLEGFVAGAPKNDVTA